MIAFNKTEFRKLPLSKCYRNKTDAATWRNSPPNTKACLLDSQHLGTALFSQRLFVTRQKKLGNEN